MTMEAGFSARIDLLVDLFRDVLMSVFQSLLQRVRAGDDAATSELFHKYEADVKRVVGAIMRVERIRLAADPSDIYQSVMASFFIRAALGQYDIPSADQLLKLLKRIARNKVADLARSPERRVSVVPIAGPNQVGIEPADPARSPVSQIIWKELFHKVRDRFTDAERRVSDLRMMGHSWEEVGAELGEKADAVRMRLERALKRIGREMNLEELSDE
jgi:RNA polymerase sigma factor (sigma-70 family)